MPLTRQLADGFPKFAEADWRAALARAKRGSRAEAIDAPPTRRADTRPVYRRHGGQPWVGVQRVDTATALDAAGLIGDDLKNGAGGVELAFAGNNHPLGGRFRFDESAGLEGAFLQNLPPGFHLRLATHDPELLPRLLLDLANDGEIDLVVAFDPIAALATGRGTSIDALLRAAAQTAAALAENKVNAVPVIADGRLWHAGGATDEQELAAVVATYVTLLRRLGIDTRIDISLAADVDQYRTIAKFRAMRLLLSRIADVAALAGPPSRIHAETAWRVMSARSPEINLLRAASGAFGAAVGGADSITVLPFDAVAVTSEAHARNLARNTLSILSYEANIHRVADPAAGSGLIEAFTASLAEAAWRRFQAIEAEGGIVAAITDGSLLQEVAEAREARLARIATGDTVMIGVNAHTGTKVEFAERAGRTPVRAASRLVFKRLPETFEAAAS